MSPGYNSVNVKDFRMSAAKMIAATISAIMLLSSAGCIISSSPPIPGSGVLALQERPVREFDEIDVRCQAKVLVSIGDETSILVQTDDNLIDFVTTRFAGDELRIDTDKNLAPVNDLIITITVPSLTDLTVRGSGDVEVQGLQESEFDLSIKGSGDVIMQGIAKRVDASITGSGSINLENLIARDVEISITGSGDAVVHAEDELDVRITGSGDVSYAGGARVERHITGSGSVQKRD